MISLKSYRTEQHRITFFPCRRIINDWIGGALLTAFGGLWLFFFPLFHALSHALLETNRLRISNPFDWILGFIFLGFSIICFVSLRKMLHLYHLKIVCDDTQFAILLKEKQIAAFNLDEIAEVAWDSDPDASDDGYIDTEYFFLPVHFQWNSVFFQTGSEESVSVMNWFSLPVDCEENDLRTCNCFPLYGSLSPVKCRRVVKLLKQLTR